MGVTINPGVNGVGDGSDHLSSTNAKVMVNGDTLFTAVGDVQILSLHSECVSNNDATASTLQYRVVPTTGSSTTISGASASLANATAGTIAVLNGTALTDAPAVASSGVALNTTSRGIIFPDGTLRIVIGTGSTTGTWKHYLRYEPLQTGAYVYANQ